MGYSAKILRDSISTLGHRLTSFEICFPRMVLSEFNTHRMFSRNSASSRAIPVEKQLRKVLEDPFVPARFGINQPGMQSEEFLEGRTHEEAVAAWLRGRDRAVVTALELLLGESELAYSFGQDPTAAELLLGLDGAIAWLKTEINHPSEDENPPLNVHKQITNRVLEPYMWHTVIVTATEWSNFFALRVDPNAQPEIYTIAKMMLELYEASQPVEVGFGQWHLPLVSDAEISEHGDSVYDWRRISTGRCARISYLTHAGKRDLDKDRELHDSLLTNGHMSPFEHPARPMTPEEYSEAPWSGNFYGWHQYRKDIQDEANFGAVKARLAASVEQ